MLETSENKLSWFDVSDDVKELLILAAKTWENTEESEKYMLAALARTEENTDVLVAAYRYFYYKNNYDLALITAEKIIARIKNVENLPDNWQELKPILSRRCEEEQIRLFLTAYAASGLVLAKLGNITQAEEISTNIKGIDDKNDFGATILLQILNPPPDEDDE